MSRILADHKPRAYVAFTAGVDFWEKANRKHWDSEHDGVFTHGIVFSTKGQVIGEQRNIDFKFRSGDFKRFFVLMEMDNLKSDIGRKSFREDIEEFSQFFINAVQKQFNECDDCLRPSPGHFDESQESELEDIQDNSFNRNDLNVEGLNFVKAPQEEQDVVALFFNLLGKGSLRGFQVYSTHASRTYDGVGKFELKFEKSHVYKSPSHRLGVNPEAFKNETIRSPKKNFIEFKYSSDGLLPFSKWLIYDAV